MNRPIQAKAARIAFENATLSYCSRFGGRSRIADPNETLEESHLMPKAKKKKVVKKKAKKTKKKK